MSCAILYLVESGTAMVEIEIDGKKVEVPAGTPVIDGCTPRRYYDPAFLLSQETVARGQLPHVHGRGGENAATGACLRHTCYGWHGGAYSQRKAMWGRRSSR